MAHRQPLLSTLRLSLQTGTRQQLLRRPKPYSTTAPPPPPNPPSSRISKILASLPPSLQKYTTRLRAAPVSHITAFLILHELTAIVPLLGLFGVFHYYVDVGPIESWMRGHYGSYVTEGMARYERYFRRKGWFGLGEEEYGAKGGEMEARVTKDGQDVHPAAMGTYKIVVEAALAYAITKALLPARILGSVWATPWFAGVLLRLRRLVRPTR